MKDASREAVTKANNIRKILAKEKENGGSENRVDMTKLAKDLAERREQILTEDAE